MKSKTASTRTKDENEDEAVLLRVSAPRSWWRRALPWGGAVLSGIMLASLFPPFGSDDAAWLSLVPLLLGLRGISRTTAFRRGFVAGAIYFVGSLFWLSRVTWVGYLILGLYCALYPALFALLARDAFRALGTKRLLSNLALMLLLGLSWMGWEYLRSRFATGFAWNFLGVSQYKRLALIQCARLGGVFTLSGVLVVINTAVTLTIFRYLEGTRRWQKTPHLELLCGFALVAAVMLYGLSVRRAPPPPSETVRVGLVQPNIPQYVKWDKAFVEDIYDRLYKLSQDAVRVGDLDLLVWPETAVPDNVRSFEDAFLLVSGLARDNTLSLLVGTLDSEWPEEGPPSHYNSSILFGPDGDLLAHYDKQHLVVFGEYVPFEKFFPFIKALTPIPSSIAAGDETVIFRLPEKEAPFAVLICFEDTVDTLARKAVRQGARWLINQTNDAWFDPHAGAEQHLAQSVFRAVENAVPVVRCTNTGVTCVILADGRIFNRMEGPDGERMFPGFLTSRVEVPLEAPRTPYTVIGNLPAASAALGNLFWLGWLGYGAVRRRWPAP